MLSGDLVFAAILGGIFLFVIALLLLFRRTLAGYREGVEDVRDER